MASTPYRLTRPYVGFRPTTPSADDGIRIDPPVSVPIEPKHRPAAVATPEPLDDMPGQRAARHGLSGTSKDGLYPAAAPSERLSFPSTTAPADLSFDTTVESKVGTKSFRTAVPPIVRTPFVQHRSLIPIGTPWSGPR